MKTTDIALNISGIIRNVLYLENIFILLIFQARKIF